jgi:cysteine desulfuration protein SufE
MSYPESLRDLIDTLNLLDRGDRIQMLIDLADRFREVPEDIASRPFAEAHKVPGCESEAYVWALPAETSREASNPGALKFYFAVENPQGISAKAMAVILDEHLSGRAAKEVSAVPGDLVYDVFGRELSMGKSMGLMGMVSMLTRFSSGQRTRAGGNSA